MKLLSFFHRTVCAAVLTLFASTPFITQAQSSPTPPLDPTIQDFLLQEPRDLPGAILYSHPLPQIQVANVAVNSTGNNLVQGTFTAKNQRPEAVGSLSYEILLLDPLPEVTPNALLEDTSTIYHRARGTEVFSVGPQEETIVPFTYQAPPVPNGTYRVRIQILTHNNHQLGWHDTTSTLGGAERFIVVDALRVEAESQDVYTNETRSDWASQEGPNVSAGQNIRLVAQVRHIGSGQISAVPTLITSPLLTTTPTTTEQTLDPIQLGPNEEREVSFDISALPDAHPYVVFLTFTSDGNQVSGVGEFRYVVEGVSASVAKQTVTDFPTNKGGSVEIDYVIAGSADRVTPFQGIVEVVLRDSEGELGRGEQGLDLEGGRVATGKTSVLLTRPVCGAPEVTFTLRANNGSVLDTYTSQFPDLAVHECASAFSIPPVFAWGAGGLVALLALTGLLLYGRKHQQTPPITAPGTPTPPTTLQSTLRSILIIMILLTGAIALDAVPLPAAKANGVTYLVPSEKGWPELFINSPTHNSTIQEGEQIYYSARFTAITCANNLVGYYIKAYIPFEGGQMSQWNQLRNTPWSKWQVGNAYRELVGSGRHGLNMYGHFNLPNNPAVDTFTLATWGRGPWAAEASDFTWVHVNRPPAPQCSDGVDNDGDGAIDAADPGCHTDEDPNNPDSYNPNHDNEEDVPTVDLKVTDPDGVTSDGPATIETGETVTLTWTSANSIATCSASGGWSGTRPTANTAGEATTPPTTLAYTLNCLTDAGVPAQDSVVVNVVAAPTPTPSTQFVPPGFRETD